MKKRTKDKKASRKRKTDRVVLSKTKHPRYLYIVRWTNDHGEPDQKYFRENEKKLAESYAADLRKNRSGPEIVQISDTERAALLEFRPRLKALGIDLRTALQYSCDHIRVSEAPTCQDWFKQYLAAKTKEGVGDRHISDINSRAKAFATHPDFETVRIDCITSEMIEEYLDELAEKKNDKGEKIAPQTVNKHRRIISQMFNHAVKKPPFYLGINPAKATTIRKSEPSETEVHTPEEVSALIDSAARLYDGQWLAYYGIRIFCGVRNAEMKRLHRRDISLENGSVSLAGKDTKKSRRRSIEIRPRLRAILEHCVKHSILPEDPDAKIYGKRTEEEHIRAAAGYLSAKGNPLHPDFPNGKPWPENADRHSFASYHLAYFKNANELMLELGEKDITTIDEHYKAVVTHADAKRFWEDTDAFLRT